MRPSGNLSSGQSRSVQTDRKIDPISSDKKVDNPATGIEMVNKFFASFRTEMKKNTQDRHAIPLTHVAPDNAETRLPMNRPQTSFGSPVQAKLPRYESRMDVRNHSPDTTADTMIAGTVQAREADARRWMTSQKAVEDNTKRTAASAARTVELLEQIKAKDFFQIETG